MTDKFVTFNEGRSTTTGLPQVVDTKIASRYATKAELQSAVIGTGGVVSPSVSRIIASSDPDTPLIEGDLLLVYEDEKYFYDLSDNGLSLISPKYTSSPRWSSEPGYVQHLGGSAVRTGMSITELDARNLGDVEVLSRVTATAYGSGFGPTIAVRGSGDSADACMLGLSLSSAGLHLGAYRSGTWVSYTNRPFTPVAEEWMWMRLRAEGRNIKGKCWPDGEEEPDSWQITYTMSASDAALMTAGWVGILAAATNTQRWSQIGVAADGATAPAVAP